MDLGVLDLIHSKLFVVFFNTPLLLVYSGLNFFLAFWQSHYCGTFLGLVILLTIALSVALNKQISLLNNQEYNHRTPDISLDSITLGPYQE
jgi:hypothetical protein